MDSSSPGRALRLLPWALLVLVGLACFAPSPARAGCSHYVVSSLSRSGVNSRTDPELFRPPNAREADPAPTAPRRDLPCSGPSCSRGPGLPHVPVPLPSVLSDQWCCTTAVPPFDRRGWPMTWRSRLGGVRAGARSPSNAPLVPPCAFPDGPVATARDPFAFALTLVRVVAVQAPDPGLRPIAMSERRHALGRHRPPCPRHAVQARAGGPDIALI